MRKLLTVAVALAAVWSVSVAPASASSPALKDCGKLKVQGGFGGPLPRGVPSGSRPHDEGFRVAGSVNCSTVVRVLNAFEANASNATTLSNPPAPGWSPCSFIARSGYVCRKGNNVILAGLVWAKGNQRVGPKPQAPKPGQDRTTAITVRCDFIVATATDTCTATVQDTVASGRSTPTGFVSWGSEGGGAFTSGSSCSLAPGQVNGVTTVGTASCVVQFTPPATTSSTVTATDLGDAKHLGSQATSNTLVPRNVH